MVYIRVYVFFIANSDYETPEKNAALWPNKFWSTLHPSANVNLCWINGFIKYQN